MNIDMVALIFIPWGLGAILLRRPCARHYIRGLEMMRGFGGLRPIQQGHAELFRVSIGVTLMGFGIASMFIL